MLIGMVFFLLCILCAYQCIVRGFQQWSPTKKETTKVRPISAGIRRTEATHQNADKVNATSSNPTVFGKVANRSGKLERPTSAPLKLGKWTPQLMVDSADVISDASEKMGRARVLQPSRTLHRERPVSAAIKKTTGATSASGAVHSHSDVFAFGSSPAAHGKGDANTLSNARPQSAAMQLQLSKLPPRPLSAMSTKSKVSVATTSKLGNGHNRPVHQPRINWDYSKRVVAGTLGSEVDPLKNKFFVLEKERGRSSSKFFSSSLGLEVSVEEKLVQLGAGAAPPCPIREEVFREAFDEIIARGGSYATLLAKIRDELLTFGSAGTKSYLHARSSATAASPATFVNGTSNSLSISDDYGLDNSLPALLIEHARLQKTHSALEEDHKSLQNDMEEMEVYRSDMARRLERQNQELDEAYSKIAALESNQSQKESARSSLKARVAAVEQRVESESHVSVPLRKAPSEDEEFWQARAVQLEEKLKQMSADMVAMANRERVAFERAEEERQKRQASRKSTARSDTSDYGLLSRRTARQERSDSNIRPDGIPALKLSMLETLEDDDDLDDEFTDYEGEFDGGGEEWSPTP